ncbi:uncharacterized protein LOC110049882 isoform X2 [Orbicella faveolata]|uniref:uncharacterized protein LOC110049882 isoform X2 n=1 Tax=Orbicella faveolata TaxID=48498 RepID=UPI0009E497A5|nr:uncharacterized protein LOC110049882 isoform X2 [Orbicella faveolata]
MDFYVDYSCKDNNETGRTKLTVSDFGTTSIRDVKYAIQAAIQAPVCDQQLFYQGQPVTDDDMTLSRLYFREGDCFKVQFLAAVDIGGMTELVDVLKNFSQNTVEKLNTQPPNCTLATEDNSDGSSLWFYDEYLQLVIAIDKLSNSFFIPWKQLKTAAQRHFFVQEGGFDAFLVVFKFSQRLNLVEDSINPEVAMQVVMQQHNVHEFCLDLLGSFAEAREEQKFILSKGVFPHVIDALLLQPASPREYESRSAVIGVNEAAIECCSGFVEYDANIQEEVSKMPPLIDKLLFMTDRYQSEPAGYSPSASQEACKALLYCTYNVKSAQPLVDCGALGKMVNITKSLDKDNDTPLRYYCCLFLARMRSAPLIKLDRDTCAAIDELIDLFLDSHVPDEMSKWEEEMSAIWMTIIPLVHLAFAAGKEYYLCSYGNDQDEDQTKDQKYGNNVHGTHQSEESCFMESEPPTNSTPEVHNASMANIKKSQGGNRLSNSGSREEKLSDVQVFGSMESTTSSMSDNKDCVIAGQKNQFLWPGSTSTQKLGVFSLVHTLSIKENLQTALSENIIPYLVCLSWRLNLDERVKLSTGLENVPSLKVAAKSVLATVYGFDMVSNL